MRFINFTQHLMNLEQIKSARKMGATEIVSVQNPARFNDDGITPAKEIAEAIAQEIAQIVVPNEVNFVHFPISSPRVMAAFFQILGKWSTYIIDKDECAWDYVYKYCKFLFSHTDRESTDVVQPDGSVKKTTVFKFKGFVEF